MSEDGRDAASDESAGFEEATERSEGSPWVVYGLNVALSTVFALAIVGGLAFLDAAAFTPVNVATAAILIFAVSYVVTLR